ncbi:hypothetical protein V1289_006768 [Bradyrhizobium sp. AZCC 2289]
MVKRSSAKVAKGRSGPRAPVGKRPLMVIIDEDLIKAAKIAAIEDGTKVSGTVEGLLRDWLAKRKARA